MGNLASGHFKPTNNIQEQHNDRTLSPSYLLPKEFRGQNEVNRYSKQAMILKNQIIENAHQTYLITFKQKSQAKSYQWSLVVNIKTNTTMSDLEKLAEHFDLKYGFQCYQIAIHRDEGYMDENNQPHTNHHAHMEFITLNKENGKNMWGQINQVKLRQIQTEIAQILGMERGTDKRVSGTERIEPRKYAQMKNKERKERLKDAKLIDELTNSMSELNAHATTLKQELETKKKEISTLKDTNLEQKEQENENLKQENKKLEQENADLNNEITTALDAANHHFKFKEPTLQKAVERTKKFVEMLFLLSSIHDNPTNEDKQKKAEQYINSNYSQDFTKLWNAIKELFSLTKLVANIKKILFGDENTEKDPQEIEQTIKELSERPTKQELQAKDKEINTLKQERTDLKDKLQAQEKTINELTKKLQEQEYNYRLERERMVAENKRLKDQGLEKTYTQKDYEQLKEQHEKEVEALKKEIQEQDKYKTRSNALRLRYRQAQQRRTMKTKKTTTPTPSPTPQQTYTKRM
ncbi:hypothetical protein [Helicobacter pylori]|uniref:hypothetical protein n=1 Tax=Helicobacter pylori TaxID=210 RepID=UPI001ABA3DE3|nr:hypothetical protein [Helicobacter pylori]